MCAVDCSICLQHLSLTIVHLAAGTRFSPNGLTDSEARAGLEQRASKAEADLAAVRQQVCVFVYILHVCVTCTHARASSTQVASVVAWTW